MKRELPKRELLSTGVSLAMIATLIAAIGCSPAQRSPDAIRQDTAKATSEVKRDTKAVVQGVEEGLKTKGPVDINEATTDQLETLAGIGPAEARRIVAGRPYTDSNELAKRHIVTKAEYDRIAGKVVTR
jgi:DNA uptake protein ComE-like DNA-binding protein